MKTLTEIAIEFGAIVHADGNIFLTNETKLQAIIDAVNARDSEPVYFIDIDGRLHDRVDDEHVEDMRKHHPIITLFTSPQPNQSAYIKRLEDALNLVAKELRMYGYQDESRDFVQSIIRKALSSKESIDG